MKRIKIAIFLDVENLTGWIGDNGPEKLLKEFNPEGHLIVAKAYGRWSNPNLQKYQKKLVSEGFDLIHHFHPVSGKNSADIQMVVDAIQCACQDEDIDCFVLATGDSDFTPLFRRLREMKKDVIGVGPKSPLSESVEKSCSRFIYTDEVKKDEAPPLANLSAKDNQVLNKAMMEKVESKTEISKEKKKQPHVANTIDYDYVIEILLKQKPAKIKSLTNEIKNMFQNRGDIGDVEIEKIINELQKRKFLRLDENKVVYLPI